MQSVNHLRTISLQHRGICQILAITPHKTLILEEYYDDGFVAQHHLDAAGHIITSSDEQHGNTCLQPLPIPPESAIPASNATLPALEHRTGAPLRGQRANDRIDGLVYPLTVADKMHLAERFSLPVPPPMLIGISESRVLSAATLDDGSWLICRRLQLAYVLMNERTTPDGTRIDYDTATFHQLQHLDPTHDLTPLMLDGIYTNDRLHRPTQCIIRDGRLYIADSGGDRLNRVHIYHVQTD